MIILGVDPGTETTGYGIIYKNKSYIMEMKKFGVIKTKKTVPFPLRLKNIYRQIKIIIKKYKPNAIAIEQVFFNKNVKSVTLVGEARGVMVLAAAESNIEVYDYTPLQVKEALVGYGRAEKHQIQNMVKQLLNLSDIPKPDDAADALAIAICHANTTRYI